MKTDKLITTVATISASKESTTIINSLSSKRPTVVIYPTVTPESVVIPIVSCIFGFPLFALFIICCLRRRAKLARERDRQLNYGLQDHAVSLVRFSPIHKLTNGSKRAVSFCSGSISRGFPSLELDTVIEEKSDPEQTQTDLLRRASTGFCIQNVSSSTIHKNLHSNFKFATLNQNSSIITNSIKIINTIIDGGENRSTSMHNLNRHNIRNSKHNIDLLNETTNKSMSHPMLSFPLTPRSQKQLMTSDRSPLWNALTTTQIVSGIDYVDDNDS
ncbi:hypothetical protein PVAND_011794 [Polypedilum vanderplanki]|uniref:Uncharacterized protein n=1 Tax=Polypedilum vanderplanki TaxID=319348 RepID=A0A9J6CJQ2_POLVA|nr:hypothetical protein PVAND_011794 [Polypedilum vanderplanki]